VELDIKGERKKSDWKQKLKQLALVLADREAIGLEGWSEWQFE
jgi:hypothetical protein